MRGQILPLWGRWPGGPEGPSGRQTYFTAPQKRWMRAQASSSTSFDVA
jgi:hypothetical protein